MKRNDVKEIDRRSFLAAASGVIGASVSGIGWAVTPCPPPTVSVTGGTTVSTPCPAAPASGKPALVQGRFTSANHTALCTSPVTIGLPNNTLSGNALIVVVQSDTTVKGAPTITDNLSSGIWGAPAVTSIGAQRIDILVGLNCPAGIHQIQVTHTGSSPNDTQYAVYEFCNIAQSSSVDGTSHNDSITGPNINAGSLTTGTDGDLIFCYGAQVSRTTAITSWSGGTAVPFGLLNAQNMNATVDVAPFAQFGIQTTHGTITPDARCNGSSGGCQMLAVALKAAAAGTAPASGIRIVTVQGYNFYAASEPTGPWTMQLPTRGNLIHLSWNALPAAASQSSWNGLSGMSDTAGNTYRTNGAPSTSADPSAGLCQQARAENATASLTNLITFNADVIATGSVTHMELYDVTGAASPTCFDTAVMSSDEQKTASATLTTASLTPSGPNELIINVTGIDAHNLSGVTGAGYLSDIADCPSWNGAGTGLDSDDGFAHVYSGSATTFVYTVQNYTLGGIDGVEGWVSYSSAYKPG